MTNYLMRAHEGFMDLDKYMPKSGVSRGGAACSSTPLSAGGSIRVEVRLARLQLASLYSFQRLRKLTRRGMRTKGGVALVYSHAKNVLLAREAILSTPPMQILETPLSNLYTCVLTKSYCTIMYWHKVLQVSMHTFI